MEMEFRIEQYVMLIMRNEKRQLTEGIQQTNQEKSEHLQKRELTST